MSDADDVLHGVEQVQRTSQEVQDTVRLAREAKVPAQPPRMLESALQQIPQVQQATAQAQRVGQAARQVVDVAERALSGAGGREALSEVAQTLAGGEPLDKVRFTFESNADPGGTWRVVELHAREGLSELYTCTVDLANEHLGADVDVLLGSSAELLIAHEAGARRLCGIIHRVEHTGTRAGHLLARVHVVPALWALSQRRDNRILQEKTVPEILKEVLTKGLQPFERSFRIELNREYLPREYCVQYRETDLDFLLRLMEEEGILFFFEHSGEKEELVLVEENEQCPTCEAVKGSPIMVKGPEAATASDECLRHFDFSQQLHTTSVVVRDFNWTHPDYDLTREARGKDALGQDREAYEYPAPLLGPYDAGEKKYQYEPAQKQQELRRQAFQVEGKRGKGMGYVTGFTPGYMFELTGHGNAALDQWYLLTQVEHHGYAPEELTSDTHELSQAGASRERYHNTFECIPLDVPFRPARRRQRARMAGLQTATVVGPASEEIHTDEHGRIKVQFHWDRKGAKDEKSSCFLRVAQVWAGLGWGFVFLPRIGMEVLVDFLEGDPDRPLVVGCVYNGKNTPPYALPEHKTRSTIRTSSSKDSDGFNELRFEDAKDAEEIFLHAQKDFNEVVLHNHSTQVKANQTNSVDGNQSESVGGDQSMSVTGKRTKNVDKDETITVKGKRTHEVTGLEKHTLHDSRDVTIDKTDKLTVTQTRTVEITGKTTETFHGGRETTVEQFDNTTVQAANKSTTVHGQYNITADEHFKITQGANQLFIKDQVYVDSAGDIQLKNGGCHATLGQNGKLTLRVNNEVAIQCGSATLTLKNDGTVELLGTKVKVGNANNNAAFEPAGTTINGVKVTSQAVGIHEIAGALIKIG